MTATQIVPLPESLAGARVEARRPKAAEMDIDPARLNHGRGRRVTIHRSAITQRLRVIAVENLLIETNLAAVRIHTDGEEVMAIVRRRGHPDLTAHHNRGGPAAIGNLRLPLDIVRLAPMQREADELGVTRRRRMAIAPGPAELRPIRERRRSTTWHQHQRQKGKQSARVDAV